MRKLFDARDESVAYVDCASVVLASKSPKTLFESILDQLAGHTVGPDSSWKSKSHCSNVATFSARLREVTEGADDSSHYILLDNADALVNGLEPNVFSWLVELAQEYPEPLGVIFIARRDWRQCATGFGRCAHPLSLHFESWTEEETTLMLTKKKREADAMDLDRKKRKHNFAISSKSAERWASTVWQSVSVRTGPLLGMGVLHVVGLDGFRILDRPRNRANELEPNDAGKSAQEFLQHVNQQDSASLYQNESLQLEPSTPRSEGKRKKRREREAAEARQKRLRILEMGPEKKKSSSLPRHEAAIVVAAFLAGLVPKEKDSQLFSEEQSRKRSSKRTMTIGQRKEGKVHSFGFERLLYIFRHVLDDAHFKTTPFWFSGVQSVVEAGYIERRKASKGSTMKSDPKIFRVSASLAQVMRLADEIGYEGVSIALEAQS